QASNVHSRPARQASLALLKSFAAARGESALRTPVEPAAPAATNSAWPPKHTQLFEPLGRFEAISGFHRHTINLRLDKQSKQFRVHLFVPNTQFQNIQRAVRRNGFLVRPVRCGERIENIADR